MNPERTVLQSLEEKYWIEIKRSDQLNYWVRVKKKKKNKQTKTKRHGNLDIAGVKPTSVAKLTEGRYFRKQ